MPAQTKIVDDPRWKRLIARCGSSPERFAREVHFTHLSPQQSDLAALVAGPASRTAVPSGHGCFAAGTLIMLASGQLAAVEDLRPGDRLMSSNGRSSRLVCELKRGQERMYRFTFSDGTTYTFNESHILCLVNVITGDVIITTVRKWLSWDDSVRNDYAPYRNRVTEFSEPSSVTAAAANAMGQALDGAINSRLANEYMCASLDARLALLAGCIDAHGGRIGDALTLCLSDGELADQIAWLAKSVGCTSRIDRYDDNEHHQVFIETNAHLIPVRKNRVPTRPNAPLLMTITKVETLGVGDYFGFVLDGNHRFLGADFMVLHNTGKTTSIANLCLWHLTCFRDSNTLLTANDMDQMKVTIWKEIGLAIGRMKKGPYAWLADYIEVLADGTARIRGFEDTWFIEAKTANAKNANKMAGRHGTHLLLIVDEASTVPDEVTSTLNGALSSGLRNRMLMTSQPTRNAGFFYRACHEMNIQNGGDWVVLRLNSADSPFVSDDALKKWWKMYDEDERLVRVLGLFPENSSKIMMGLRDSERMYRNERIIKDEEAWGWLVLSDVALGEGLRDKSASVVARVIGEGDERRVEVVDVPFFTNGIRANRLPHHIRDAGDDLSNPTWGVDAGGIGGSTCQDLEDMGIPVQRIHWGNPCFRTENRLRYLNLRAQAMHGAARAAKSGRLVVLTSKYRQAIIDQSSRIPKDWTGKSQIRVPEKGSTAWEGMKSPDLWDAICFAFLEGMSYMPASTATPEPDSDRAGLEDLARSLVANIA